MMSPCNAFDIRRSSKTSIKLQLAAKGSTASGWSGLKSMNIGVFCVCREQDVLNIHYSHNQFHKRDFVLWNLIGKHVFTLREQSQYLDRKVFIKDRR